MADTKQATITEFLEQRLLPLRHEWSDGYKTQLRVSVRKLVQWGGDLPLRDLTPEVIATWLGVLRPGRSARTVNNKRRDLFTVLQAAHEMGLVEKEPPRRLVRNVSEPRRKPRAWRPEEMRRVILGCRAAPSRRGWGPRQWEALVCTIYDTSLRVGCLLKSQVSQVDFGRHELNVSAELQKTGEETVHRLHPDTTALLQFERSDARLFPWPFHVRDLWLRFGQDVLKPAGLPAGHRDKFHKIRRTSYTQVYCRFGLDAASQHASHRTNMSRFYLDESMLPQHDPLEALPRPV